MEIGRNMTGITWTGPVLRMDYEISLQAKRVAGSDFFCGLTFPVDDSYCSLICGGWGGVLVGLSCIDFRDADDNETGVGYGFVQDRWYRIRLRVTTDLIEAWIDEDLVVELESADRILTVRDEVAASCPLGIATWRTSGAVRDIVLRQINPKPRYQATDTYEHRRLQGWPVLVSRVLHAEHPDLTQKTLEQLNDQLQNIISVMPAATLRKLQQIKIWVEHEDKHYACTCYHPDGEWLKKRGYNPEKAGCVEIANARNFLTWSVDRPCTILHELAHAYHHQVIGHDHPELKRAFQQAHQSGRYDRVRHVSDEQRRHPAKNSVTEYFAQGTEAFFGRNDYHPFTRDQLEVVDPELHALLGQLCGL